MDNISSFIRDVNPTLLKEEYLKISSSYTYNESEPFKTIKLPYVNKDLYPYIASLREDLSHIYNFKKTFFSFIYLSPNYCYHIHKDEMYFIHIPIITNDDSYLIVKDKLIQLEIGKCYFVNTTLPHTAYNLGKENRVHLIMGVNL